jgi:hypothetical protein
LVEAVGTGGAGATNATCSATEIVVGAWHVDSSSAIPSTADSESSPVLVHRKAILSGRVTEVPLLDSAILNDKEKTDEDEYEG